MRTVSEEEHKAAELAESDDHSDSLSRQTSTISRNSSWGSLHGLHGRTLMKKILSRRGSKAEVEPEATEAVECEDSGKEQQRVERVTSTDTQ
ncbi:uncharacterized protein RCC_02385 [Ramularia collo-cygni]|uniref:Uncharacterized protein n=1 Tax=Ramularia collo-cygni TaxID=112498 RepID=A0A2D3UNM7_9PEZI|nr:uncharacterized protein RCC_02385 [Ramularia collo-cygni]CZT16551.1 uncharacterized protein RCC_02385 [Ramularia collo-cygni]